MENPTVIVGQTQSGKTFRAFRLFAVHDGPAIFYDTQWRAGHYLPGALRVRSLDEFVKALVAWREGEAPPRIVFEPIDHGSFPRIVDGLLRHHLIAHVENRPLPKTAFFVDEVSLLADRSADATNPAVRLFTQGYQHGLIGVAITQRPALTTRHIVEQAWEAYIFSPGPVGVKTLEDYGWVPPDWAWVQEPRSYHYWRYDGARWLKGDAEGVEREVAEVPELQGDTESALSSDDESGHGEADVPIGQNGMSEVRPDVHPGPPAEGT